MLGTISSGWARCIAAFCGPSRIRPVRRTSSCKAFGCVGGHQSEVCESADKRSEDQPQRPNDTARLRDGRASVGLGEQMVERTHDQSGIKTSAGNVGQVASITAFRSGQRHTGGCRASTREIDVCLRKVEEMDRVAELGQRDRVSTRSAANVDDGRVAGAEKTLNQAERHRKFGAILIEPAPLLLGIRLVVVPHVGQSYSLPGRLTFELNGPQRPGAARRKMNL